MGRCGDDEAAPADGAELAHGDAVAGHDEALTLVEPAHDFPALVAELTLGYLTNHGPNKYPCYGS